MKESSLILEGGGMRGVYTAGVLEYFMEQELEFPYVIGVSAGACQAMSYISKQRGRNKEVTVGMANNPNYIRYKGLIDGSGLFNMDFIFNELPNKLVRFDYDTFRKSKQEMIAVATNCKTGEPVYLNCKESKTNDEMNMMVRASSSLPLIASAVRMNDMDLLDGGLADSIPIKKAMNDGYEKNVIILTRPNGYRKSPSRNNKIYELLLGKNCEGAKLAIRNRYKHYNEALDHIDKLKYEGKAFVICPSESFAIKRAERDKLKLEEFYNLGYKDAKESYRHLLAFLEG